MAGPLLNITLVGKTETIARLVSLGPSVMGALQSKVQALVIQLQRHVVADKLSGQVLNVVSGALRRSIQQKVEATATSVLGRVYSAGDVKYAAIHEFGGRTPAHDIYPTKAQALMFSIGGRTVFAKVVHHPGSQMPMRSFMRSALADQAPDIKTAIIEAARLGARSAGR